MNDQQEVIAWVGFFLILLSQVRNGFLKDAFLLITGDPTKAGNLGGDLAILIGEIVLIVVLVMFADGEEFGEVTVGFVLTLALLAVFIVVNGPDVLSGLGITK